MSFDCASLRLLCNASAPNRSVASSVSPTSSQVVLWLMMQSLSESFFASVIDEMRARSSQKTRASTFRLTFSRVSSSRSRPAGFTRKHTIPSEAGFSVSSMALSRTYASARAASSIPWDTA